MKRLVVIGFVVSMLGACTTERIIEPTDPKRASELNAQLGLGYMQQGQYKRAMRKLNRALTYDEDNAQAYHYMAELYRRLGENDKAEENYQKSLSLNPKDPDTQNNYGVFLCSSGHYDKADKHFDSIINDPLYQYKADAYENIGLCAYRQGKMQKADNAFRQALQINSKMAKSLLKMAQISYDRRRKTDAYDYFRRYISLAPHTPESLWIGILIETGRGNKNTVASYKVLLKGKFPASKETKLLKKLESQGKL